MAAVAFDTLKLARSLRDTAQMSQVQAEGVADALAEAMSGAELATKNDIRELATATKNDIREQAAATKNDIRELAAATKNDIMELAAATKNDFREQAAATKNDIMELATATKNDFRDLEAATKRDITSLEAKLSETKAEIIKWMFGALAAQGAMIVALIKLTH